MRTRYLLWTTILLALVCSAVLLWKMSSGVHQTSQPETVHEIKVDNLLEGILQLAFDDLSRDLNVADQLEQGLLLRAMTGKTTGGPKTITIILVRPVESDERCEVYESRTDEQSFLVKMIKLRTNKAVKPIGFINTAAITEGKLFTDHAVLEYRSDDQWHEIPFLNSIE